MALDNRTSEEAQLQQLKKSCQRFIDDVFHELDTGLVIGTVLEADRRRHDFEYRLLMPFMRQTLTYLAQWSKNRCNHIHNAHGIARCLDQAIENERYCQHHKYHRDNYPTPRLSQEEVDRITAQEIAEMKGEVYQRSYSGVKNL